MAHPQLIARKIGISGLALVVGLGLGMGCKGSSSDEETAASGEVWDTLSVETTLSATRIQAGGKTTITCLASGKVEGLTSVTFAATVSPTTGIEMEKTAPRTFVLRAETTGQFDVSCSVEGTTYVDSTPAVLTVDAGDPVLVETIVDPSEVELGQSAAVDCVATDAYGNAVEADFSIQAPDDVTVSSEGGPQGSVSSDEPGTFEITCIAEDFEVKSLSAMLTVRSAGPAEVELTAEPFKDIYSVNNQATFTWVIRDASGNVLDEADYPEMTATLLPPEGGVEWLEGTKYRLLEQGYHVFRVEVGHPTLREPLFDEVELLVDSGAPEVVLDFPKRGEEVQGAVGEPVVVEGTVIDGAGLESFTINGISVEVADDGTFAVEIAPVWGLNMLEVEATDALGEFTRLTPSFYWSLGWLPETGETDATAIASAAALPASARMYVGQNTLDDGVHDFTKFDDLATSLEWVLNSLDPESLLPPNLIPPIEIPLPDLLNFEIPGPLGTSISIQGDVVLSVVVEAVTIGDIGVWLDTREGGIDAVFELGSQDDPALALPISIVITAPTTTTVVIPNLFGPDFELEFETVGTSTLSSGLGVVELAILASTDVSQAPGETLSIEVVDISFEAGGIGVLPITEATIDFGTLDLPIVGTIPLVIDLAAVAPGLFDLVELLTLDGLWGLVEPLIAETLPPLFDTLLSATLEPLFDLLVLDLPLPIPSLADPNETVELALHVRPDYTQFTEDGGAFGLSMGFGGEPVLDYETLGQIRRANCLGVGADEPLAWAWEREFAFAGQTDLLNQILFALWSSGAVTVPVDLGALGLGDLPVDDLTIELDPLMPGIVNDCRDEVLFQVGDLGVKINASTFGVNIGVQGYIDVSMGVQILANGTDLGFELGDFDVFDFEVTSVSGGLGDLFDIESLVTDTLLPLIVDSIPGTQIGPLPIGPIPLDTLLPGAPPGAALTSADWSTETQGGETWLGFDFE